VVAGELYQSFNLVSAFVSGSTTGTVVFVLLSKQEFLIPHHSPFSAPHLPSSVSSKTSQP